MNYLGIVNVLALLSIPTVFLLQQLKQRKSPRFPLVSTHTHMRRYPTDQTVYIYMT